MDAIPQSVDAAIEALFEPYLAFNLDEVRKASSAREFPRTPFRGRAQAVVLPPPSSTGAEPVESEVVTTDISRGGVSILHQTELHRGQQLFLKLAATTCTVEIRWCCQVWPGLFIAGCQFVDPLFPDSLGTQAALSE